MYQTKYIFTQNQPACNSEKCFDLLSEKWKQRLCIEDYPIAPPPNIEIVIIVSWNGVKKAQSNS